MSDKPNWVAEMVKDVLRQQSESREELIRKHFADTPIALATVERLKIMPWDVEVLTMKAEIPKNPRADPAHAHMLIFEEKARVVEYLPRRWEQNSVRASDHRHDLYLFKARHEFMYGGAILRPDAFIKVVP